MKVIVTGVEELGKSRLAGFLFSLFLRLLCLFTSALFFFASAVLFFPGLFSFFASAVLFFPGLFSFFTPALFLLLGILYGRTSELLLFAFTLLLFAFALLLFAFALLFEKQFFVIGRLLSHIIATIEIAGCTLWSLFVASGRLGAFRRNIRRMY